MKQLLQQLRTGETQLVEAPAPQASKGKLLIRTRTSLVSAGTERMLVEFGKANLIDKARQQPDKVRMVLDKVKTDGLATTLDAVRSKLNQPLPLGYCNVGRVEALGEGVSGFTSGDRVISNGPHADLVVVPKNLCARIPDQVDDESAAFTVLASIGLQGIRLAQPTLGEAFVVTGAGLIGLLTVQLLRAQGCRVLAIDVDGQRLELARQFGAETCNPAAGEDPVAAGLAFSRDQGIDGVIITASTKSSDPVSQAAQMCRKRGRIVLVGVTGLELSRADFYEKELSFQVSCSYGPGRYDPVYEEQGQDYPLGYVRWTEQRNFEAVLDMMASGRLDVAPLITHRFAFDEAPEAYAALIEDRSVLGILLQYSEEVDTDARLIPLQSAKEIDASKPVVGFIGAGNYASRVLIPAFQRAGAQLHTLVTESGISGALNGEKAGFANASTDVAGMLADPEINTVVVVTRHNSHAQIVRECLEAGKHVFVEKPLAINWEELAIVEQAYRDADGQQLMLGFNRRFAPLVQKMKGLLEPLREPKSFIMTVNAGAIPADHWTQDPGIGGGRIIGEACHFIDLMRYLAGAKIVSVQARRMERGQGAVSEDKAVIILGFADGSFGTIHYLANGASSFPKERIEVFVAGRVLQLDNFRKLKGFGWPGFSRMSRWKQDKGQAPCAQSFLRSIHDGESAPIPVEEVFEVARVTLEAADLLRSQ
ncbi:dehydrogenase [Motiliproteus coralliicola]|uniref:Dehydrogenase n=1 Tax=Motiliproteus coralliicola TaxID=2283196 RepID=A0A369WLP0_9GAMM|nr:bi-domain-containing oxidoreductase [Motiliproteus coralliicola]RDE22990.1 dehydrogenase [Motiliproteus coralliicola]